MPKNIELIRSITNFSREQEKFYSDRCKYIHAEPFRVLIDYLSKGNEIDDVILDDFYEMAHHAIEDRRDESAILARDAELKIKAIKELDR